MRLHRHRPLLAILSLAVALAFGLVGITTSGATGPAPVVLSVKSGPPGTTIHVTLPASCVGQPSIGNFLSVTASTATGGAGAVASLPQIAPGASASSIDLVLPGNIHKNTYRVLAVCSYGPSYGPATFSVTSGPTLTATQISTTSGHPGSTVTVPVPCHPNGGEAFASAAMFASSDPYLTSSATAHSASPAVTTIHVHLVVPASARIGKFLVGSNCFDYTTSTDHTAVAFTVTSTTPGAPRLVKANPGKSTASVSWSAPSNTGGLSITGYAVTPHLGSTTLKAIVFNSTATQHTIGGLQSGKAYTFHVKAKNTHGYGPSATSAPIIVGAPPAPTGVVGSPGTHSVKLKWHTLISNGSTIAGVLVTIYGPGSPTTKFFGGNATSQTITGLQNGTNYGFAVAAKNGHGLGPKSAPSNAVVAGAPTTPTSVVAVNSASGSLSVSFTVASNNGSAVSTAIVTCLSTNGGLGGQNVGGGSPVVVSGLTPGKSYKCTARVLNNRGTSPESSPSASATA